MAVGIIPKYTEEYPLDGLTPQHFIVIADEAVKILDWKISFLSETVIIAYTNDGVWGRNYEVKIVIEDEKARLKSSSMGNEMVDLGKNKKNLKKLISTLNEFKHNVSDDELELKYQTIKEQLVLPEDEILKLPPTNIEDQLKGIFSIFIPKQGYFVTPILVNINILILILMGFKGVNILMPDNESLLNWGANFRPFTLDGQWWRLITNIFLHIGVMHLLLNMYALVYIGLLLEPHLGKLKFISAYLLTGLTASIASLWWHDTTISAGASGAIFGMYGVFLALLTTDLIEKTARKAFLTSIIIFVVYNLVNGLKGNIDNAAHIGGLIGGLIIGYCFTASLKKTDDKPLSYSIIGILTFLVIALCTWVYKSIPNDIAIYENDMKQFASYESMALEVFSLPKGTPKDKLLDELKNRGLYYWNEDLEVVNKAEKLKLPDFLQTKNAKLKQYCELRIKSYELIYKAIDENTSQYKPQLESYNKNIKDLIDNIKTDNNK